MAQKLFIGGLAFSTSTERLREVFAAAGQVESAAVVTDRDTGRSRGFGFVEMATPEEAELAITQFNGKDLDGRQIRVEKASASGGGAGGGGGRSPRGFGGPPRGGSRW
jgi:RNA recognition motif-containing protein